MKATTWLLLGFVSLYSSSMFLVQTWFVPDEYWQSLEIAHLHVFKYGYSTWEWHHGLRSCALPLVFAALYWVLKVTCLDYTWLVVNLPRFVQALFSAVGVLYTCKLSSRQSGCRSVPWTAAALATSWVLFYCASRTLYNSTETSLTMIALYFYPWPVSNKTEIESKNVWKFVSIAAASAIVRPTALVLWVPLCVWHLSRSQKRIVWFQYFTVGAVAAVIQLTMDSLYYGKVTFTPYNFLRFNVLTSLSSHYGTHPWHWYISQGFPTLLTTHLIPFVLAVRRNPCHPLIGLIIWTVAAYSLLGHKEFRFILPVVPMAACVIGDYLASIANRSNGKKLIGKPHLLTLLLFVSNFPVALYFGLVHQKGTIDVISYLANVSKRDPNVKILFLMPCHSTPYYSHIHQNISMQFLGCEPNLEFLPNYEDEADQFYQSPVPWLSVRFKLEAWHRVLTRQSIGSSTSAVVENGTKHDGQVHTVQLPTHVVIFDVLYDKIQPFFVALHYKKCAEFFHAHFAQGRVGKSVQVFCLPSAFHKTNLKES